jgi:hypothetical protein
MGRTRQPDWAETEIDAKLICDEKQSHKDVKGKRVKANHAVGRTTLYERVHHVSSQRDEDAESRNRRQ